ncbi:hypothetical protein E2562_000595 [Oryza meyeriana var. granulata]|uniref:Uncharacterized protein n=1 Tax=Oryza meyeriana var. granulata TaxID=110450 RepID=A0A6G1DU12_9ORYZ|nr:hypothetical protein E2562_000595 [Oryza meyeriana var. granulata]
MAEPHQRPESPESSSDSRMWKLEHSDTGEVHPNATRGEPAHELPLCWQPRCHGAQLGRRCHPHYRRLDMGARIGLPAKRTRPMDL